MKNFLMIATALCVALAASTATPDTLITTGTYSQQDGNYAGKALVGAQQFNPSLGTLNSVTLSISGTEQEQMYATKVNPISTYYYYLPMEELVTGSGLSTQPASYNIDAWKGFPGGLPIPGRPFNSSPSVTTFVNDTWNGSSPAVTYTLPSDLAFFTGAGSVSLQATNYDADSLSPYDPLGHGYEDASISGASGGPSGSINTVNVSAQITYDYTPVPEPSTFVLLGIGAISLLAYAWRRRTRTA